MLRAIETFDESLFGIESLPPPKLSDAPPRSLPTMITIPPHDDLAFSSLPPPSSEAVPISILPPSEDELGEFPTLPPRPPPPPRKR